MGMTTFPLSQKEERFVAALRNLASPRLAVVCQEMLTTGQTLDAVKDVIVRAAHVVEMFDDA